MFRKCAKKKEEILLIVPKWYFAELKRCKDTINHTFDTPKLHIQWM